MDCLLPIEGDFHGEIEFLQDTSQRELVKYLIVDREYCHTFTLLEVVYLLHRMHNTLPILLINVVQPLLQPRGGILLAHKG